MGAAGTRYAASTPGIKLIVTGQMGDDVGTYAITGSASGIGAATAVRLEQDGHTVIGVDVQEADIVADLSQPEGRKKAIDQILEKSNERLEGLIPCAGLMGLPHRPGSLLVSLNFFGSVELFNGLREALAQGTAAAAVGISSNSTTVSPAISSELVEACLEGDEERACRLGDEAGSIMAYPATKMALAYWVRRNATEASWIGAGINLNAIAPGMIETAMVAEGRADPILAPHLENFQIPVGRSGRPEEIAELLAFLLGPSGRFFVGSILFCDGGTDAQTRPNDWPSVLPT